jgi:superfamily II DNA or RNA helicase
MKQYRKNVFFVSGKIKTKDRIEIKKKLEELDDAIVLASYKTFGTGVSINNLHNAIFAQGYKGRVRILQAIGRTLRLHKSKTHVTICDICDTFEKNKKSFSMKHFRERFKMYQENKFNVEIKEINL